MNNTWIPYSVNTFASEMRAKTVPYYVVTVVEEYIGPRPRTAISLCEGTAPYDGTSLIVMRGVLHATAQILYWDTQNIWLPGTGLMFSAS